MMLHQTFSLVPSLIIVMLAILGPLFSTCSLLELTSGMFGTSSI